MSAARLTAVPAGHVITGHVTSGYWHLSEHPRLRHT